eukprot:15438695-Alexandrium_andersonii.AAC.1
MSARKCQRGPPSPYPSGQTQESFRPAPRAEGSPGLCSRAPERQATVFRRALFLTRVRRQFASASLQKSGRPDSRQATNVPKALR